jgi:hypothetical protein
MGYWIMPEKYLLTILHPKVLIFAINYYFYVSEKNVGAHLPMNFLIPNSVISSLLAVLITGCTALLAQKTTPADKAAKDKIAAKKEQSEATKKADAAAELPSYYNSYASAGIFRNESKRMVKNDKDLRLMVSVPVLASIGLTTNQSKALFKQAIIFHATGYDAETQFANENGRGNVPLSAAVMELLGKDFSGIDLLYKHQVDQGNVLVVDDATKFPLMIKGGTYAPEFNFNDELTEYHSAIYYWAAAYPWLFYEIKNNALRQTLLEKDMRLLSYFAQHRFALDGFIYEAILASDTPLKNQFNN